MVTNSLEEHIVRFYVERFCNDYDGKGVLRILPHITYSCIAHLINYESRKHQDGKFYVIVLSENSNMSRNIYADIIHKIEIKSTTKLVREKSISADNINIEFRNIENIRGILSSHYDLVIVTNKTIPLNSHHYIAPYIHYKRRNGELVTKIVYLPKTLEYVNNLKYEKFYFSDSNWSEQTYFTDLREYKLKRILKNNNYE